MSLLSRIVGVIASPRATFENVVAAPRPFGVLLIVALVIGIGSSIPQFTEAGRQAAVDAQVKAMEGFGMTVTPEAYERIETQSRSIPLKIFGAVSTLVFLPIWSLLLTAVLWAAFNAILGGTGTFKQVLAIVTHSQVIGALGLVIGLPIQLMQNTMSMAGPFNLRALAPWLEEGSKLGAYLGSISVFNLWGIVVTAIGLSVLYRRNARNIAIGLLVVFLLLMYGFSSLFGSFMGGSR
jgi:hypothetical protein